VKDKLKLIKEIILNAARKYDIEIEKIILFGSRAKGNYKDYSDWDILIVTREELDKKVLDEFWEILDWELAKYIVPEIIIIDNESLKKYSEYKGFVYYWALKEGITIE
jgi:Nucleotidyltransferase domain.